MSIEQSAPAEPTFPATISYGDLKAVSPDYRLDLYLKFYALYEGGERFNAMKDTFLIKRQYEGAQPERKGYVNPKASGDPYVNGQDIQAAAGMIPQNPQATPADIGI